MEAPTEEDVLPAEELPEEELLPEEDPEEEAVLTAAAVFMDTQKLI